jgi:hypothetical protein
MKPKLVVIAIVLMAIFCFVPERQTYAQAFGQPLTFQGLNHTTQHSAASRALGGTRFGVENDVSLMFEHPASLTSLAGVQLVIGGFQNSTTMKQDQRYGALQTHSALSFLMEGSTGLLSDPDTSRRYGTTQVRVLDQADSVQRPFDDLGPNWNRSKSAIKPLQGFLGVPLTLEAMKVVVGVGVVEYANLNWYYQNNNCLSPSVLSVLNGTISTVGLNVNPYLVQWYQYEQQRDGSIYGYGGALSVAVSENLSVGFSAMLLKGSTDDQEVRVGRGRLEFFQNSIRIGKLGMTDYMKTGTSEFSGQEYSLSAQYSDARVEFGASLKPPTTITRKYSYSWTQDSVTAVSRLSHRVDSLHALISGSGNGEDNIKVPWQGTIGFGLRIRENLTVSMDYELRSFGTAQYTDALGAVSNPWLSASIFRFGAEFIANDWLSLRVGVCNYKEIFEPLSNPIRGDAVDYPIYTIGCGVTFEQIRLNIAYEYSEMKYVDTWSNAASVNTQMTNNIVADISYALPW